jgi:hypothetical protein
MLPLWPFLFGGRAGDFGRGFILEGPPRAAWRHERGSGSGPLWDFACEREQDDELFGPTRIQRQRETNVEHHCQADDVWASLEVAQGLRGVIPKCYAAALPASSQFLLTKPLGGQRIKTRDRMFI